MNPSSPFIKRPVMTIMVMLGIILFGSISYNKLPVSNLPGVDYPTIVVSADMPGGDPQYMADSVATPLERAFTNISGLKAMTSTNTVGNTEIILNFDLNRNIDSAEVEVQGNISKTIPLLPPLPYNPSFKRANPSESPILFLALSSNTQQLADLWDYADDLLAQPISMIEGVSEVDVYGYPYAVRVQANPELLTARNLDFNDLANRLVRSNPNLPGGTMVGIHQEFVIEPFGMLTSGPEYNEVIIKEEKGLPLKVKDIGNAVSALKGRNPFFKLVTNNQEQPTVLIAVKRQANANTIAVTKKIYQELPELNKSIPTSVTLSVFYNQAAEIIGSVHDVEMTLLIAFGLVVLVIFFYFGKITETIIPALVLPMSIIATFIVMYLAGFNLDILSLLALMLSIGFIVDDTIVVLENIVRHVEMGKTPYQAAIDGSKQISLTVLTMTIALSAVFIPMIGMPGILGRVFREFSITIIVTIYFSGFIALTLNPMLCSRLLRQRSKDRVTKKNFSERMNSRLASGYMWLLRHVLRFKALAILVGAVCLVCSFLMLKILPFDLIPAGDIGFIQGVTECEQGSSIINTNAHQELVDKKISENPYQNAFISITGNPTDDQGVLYIRLKEKSKRPDIMQIIKTLKEKFSVIPGIDVYLRPLPLINLQIGSTSGLGEYQYAMNSLYPDKLYPSAAKMTEKMKKIPDITGVNSDMKVHTPQLNFYILRDQAGIYGVNAEDIEKILQNAFAAGRLSFFNLRQNQYDLIVETLHPYQYNVEDLDYLYVRSTQTEELVPLTSVARWEEVIAASAVNHLNQFPAVTVSFNLAKGAALGTAIEKINAAGEETLPQEVMGRVIGGAAVFLETFATIKWLILLAIIVIYLILGILYESFLHPLTVLSGLPVAGFGAFITLLIFGETFSLYGIVGIIVLIGLVQKNGIMMIDYALEYLEKPGETVEQAILEACQARFRPILMTTLAAMMGALPIALGMGAGATPMRSLGLTIVGGLIFSQALTLFITPVVFIYLENFREWIKRKTKGKAENTSQDQRNTR